MGEKCRMPKTCPIGPDSGTGLAAAFEAFAAGFAAAIATRAPWPGPFSHELLAGLVDGRPLAAALLEHVLEVLDEHLGVLEVVLDDGAHQPGREIALAHLARAEVARERHAVAE